MKNKSLLISVAILVIAMHTVAQVTDKDGNNYKTVKIGTQEWMAENLDVSQFRNGDLIPQAMTGEEWIKAGDQGKPSWCYYDNDPANGQIYGKLYNWFAVNDSRGVAPNGWHVPSYSEWADITNYLGGVNEAGSKMKYTEGWKSNGNGTNESGFAGLASGNRYNDGMFLLIGSNGDWWSTLTLESSTIFAWYSSLKDDNADISMYVENKVTGHSVRCVRD